MASSDGACEAGFELLHDPAGAQLPAFQNLLDRPQFAPVKPYLGYGNSANGGSSLSCFPSLAILCWALGFGKSLHKFTR
jgi:hypothetical protein